MEPFQSSAGKTVAQPDGYLAFVPSVLPPMPELAFDEKGAALQADAAAALGRLQGIGQAVPNPDLFLGIYVRKEAVLSSQIEDIECTLDDVLRFEEGDSERPGISMVDVAQVVNYVRAVNLGFEQLHNGVGISLELLRTLHAILAPDAERPGAFRETQNWIGSRNRDTDVRTARYVPPPVKEMHERLINLMYYINEYQGPSPLVRAAVAHAQFESIHPFDDGNGRIGRILVALMFRSTGALDRPLLYLSRYLRNNRREYYDRLMAVREKGEWSAWIDFFTRGVRSAADDAADRARRIVDLREQGEKLIEAMPANTRLVLDALFTHPIVDARSIQRQTGLGFEGAQGALKRLEAAGWLREITGRKRNRTYRFEPYLSILESGEAMRQGPPAGGPGSFPVDGG